jgi:hypothetical protein
MLIQVEGPARSTETAKCFLQLTAHVVGGGTAVTCLTGFRGQPGPYALVRLTGTIAFHLPHRRLLRYRVLIVDRFAADGKHATQRITSKGISGGGTFVEDPPGNVRASNLIYGVP